MPEYDGAGVVREPSGSTLTGIVPTNTYRCRDGKYVIIGGNGDSIFQRLMRTAGRPEMATDPRLADNAGRVSVADMMQDPHFHARGLFQGVEIDGKPLKIPAIPPFLRATPGGTTWPGPAVGVHNREILGGVLRLSDAALAALQREGVI